ncbi:MAG: sensor histidine kinase [Burkholderiales bacterium]
MSISPRGPRGRAAFCAIVAWLVACAAHAADPKRVLVLHSFGRETSPHAESAAAFRTDLARRYPGPVVFTEANLDFGRAVSDAEQASIVNYLRERFVDAPPDVVATMGAPAARFYAQHRAELFPGVPLLVGALDERNARQIPLQPQDAVAAVRTELPRLVDNILTVLPDTETIAMVIGTSQLERFWMGEVKRELALYEGRVQFEWLNTLSLPQMEVRVATMPPRSAILYLLLLNDAAGVPHERLEALTKLRAVANAPIFGVYEAEFGSGVVGGPFTAQGSAGERLATAALRALGEPGIAAPRFDVRGFEPPVYDWRELERWKIDPARLPPGSAVRFKPPTVWEDHHVAITLTAAVFLLQAALIAGLLIQRSRRRRAEDEARHLGGRILTAQEDERRRLAREMHDDVTQRLAALAIDTGTMQSPADASSKREALETVRGRLVGLSEDVHALSYRLHPSVIEDLGLVAALRVECNRVARQEPIAVEFDGDSVPRQIPADAAICLFRIAQEALRNVVRHARATEVKVALCTRDGGVELAVRDNGQGLRDAEAVGTSLGLVSMRERVRLVGGRLSIASRPGQGTAVVAWVPLREAA